MLFIHLVAVNRVGYLFFVGQNLTVARHTEGGFLESRDAVILKNVPVHVLVILLLLLFELIVALLLLDLLLRHVPILALRYLLNCKRPLDHREHVLRDQLLYLERQVFLEEVVRGARHPEIIIRGVPDRLNLVVQVFLCFFVLLRIDLHNVEAADVELVLTADFVGLFDEHLQLFLDGLKVNDLRLGLHDPDAETVDLVLRFALHIGQSAVNRGVFLSKFSLKLDLQLVGSLVLLVAQLEHALHGLDVGQGGTDVAV